MSRGFTSAPWPSWDGWTQELASSLASCVNSPLSNDLLCHETSEIKGGLIALLKLGLNDHAVLKNIALNSYRHPLGFTKILIWRGASGKSIRVHDWPSTQDERSTAPLSDIHDHYWEFRSSILRGALRFREYEINETGEEYTKYEMNPLGNGNHILTKVATVGLSLARTVVIPEGGRYALGANTLHDTTSTQGAISLVVQGAKTKTTNIVLRKGEGPQTIDNSKLPHLRIDELQWLLRQLIIKLEPTHV